MEMEMFKMAWQGDAICEWLEFLQKPKELKSRLKWTENSFFCDKTSRQWVIGSRRFEKNYWLYRQYLECLGRRELFYYKSITVLVGKAVW